MKTYISAGIGDLFFLDSILTTEEKESITEIYWACRFGYVLKAVSYTHLTLPTKA